MGRSGNNISVEVIAYGVPALLLIVLGFIAYMSGSILDVLLGNSGTQTVGIILIILGILLFILVAYLENR